MADTKISALTDGDPALSTDEIPAARAGGNVKLTAGSIAGLASPSDFQPAIVTGNYYISPSVGAATTLATYNTAGIQDNIVAYPIWFSSSETWTRIGTYVDTPSGVGAVIRIGIWENAAGNILGDLLVDSGPLSLEASGEVEATISAALTANTLYWIGGLANDGLAELARATASRFPFVAGGGTVNGIYSNGYEKAQAYGALPDPFGAPDSEDAVGAGNVPIFWLRKV